jgi:ribosomal protein L32
MAVPKKKRSKSKTKTRKANWLNLSKLSKAILHRSSSSIVKKKASALYLDNENKKNGFGQMTSNS